MAVFYEVAPCRLIDISEVLVASIIRVMIEAVGTSETSTIFSNYNVLTTMSEVNILCTRYRGNPKFKLSILTSLT